MNDKLAALFDGPDLGWLVDRLVTRIERGQPLDRGSVALADATPAQRRAVDDLLGRRSSTGKILRLDLVKLCESLHTDAEGLCTLVTRLRGQVDDLRASRDAQAAAWGGLFAEWNGRLSVKPALSAWLAGLRASGLLKRLSGGDAGAAGRLMEQACEVVDDRLHDDILLATLAARVTGDSHALDRGQPLATLCLRAINEMNGIDGGGGAEARREAWASLGVCLDDLSAPVLCLNLRPAPGSGCSGWIDWHVVRGEPFYLTWRQVRAFDPDPAMGAVHVCENPAIVSEAANRLGSGCQPLVCLNGVPSSPVRRLLRRLGDAGIHLLLRADFDWTGLRIVDGLYDPARCRLWRMTREDYLACQASQKMAGKPFLPDWAGELGAAMSASGLAGYEEDLIDLLVGDLADQ